MYRHYLCLLLSMCIPGIYSLCIQASVTTTSPPLPGPRNKRLARRSFRSWEEPLSAFCHHGPSPGPIPTSSLILSDGRGPESFVCNFVSTNRCLIFYKKIKKRVHFAANGKRMDSLPGKPLQGRFISLMDCCL